jgi:hypothetical protein
LLTVADIGREVQKSPHPPKLLTFFMNAPKAGHGGGCAPLPEWNGSVIGGWHPVLSPLVCVLEQLCKCLLH